MTFAKSPGSRLQNHSKQKKQTLSVSILTSRTFVVEHSIGPNADIEFAGHETVCVFVPCGQLTFVLMHARVLVVRI